MLTRERKADEVYVFGWRAWKASPCCTSTSCLAKEKIEAEVDKLGIYWETDDYIPLPEFTCRASTTRWRRKASTCSRVLTRTTNTDTWQVENAWINEINELDDTTYFNTATGAAKGIKW